MQALGINAGQRSFNIDPTAYFHQGDINQINQANVAKQEEYARAQALAELSGGPPLLDPNNISQANTADQYVTKIDQDKLKGDLTKKSADYDKEYKSGKGTLNRFIPADIVKGVGYGSTFGTEAPQILSASPQEIEKKWIPLFEQRAKGNPQSMASNQLPYLKKALTDWQHSQGYDRQFSLNKKG